MARKRPAATAQQDERAALFAAVKETPDDDAPRLVLADWLEEYGDEDDRAHAELIRVQCEILRLSASLIDPHSPDAIHALLRSAGYHTSVLPHHFSPLTSQDGRIAELRRREVELIGRWTASGHLHALSFDHLCDWHRGFAVLHLNYAPFRAREMAAFAASPFGPRVEGLKLKVLTGNRDTIARSPLLAHAVGLYADSRDADVLTTLLASANLAGLRRFAELFIGRKVAALEGAPQRDRLTHLYLHSSRLDPNQLRSFAGAGWPSLGVLHLGGGELGLEGAEALAGGAFLANLRELDLTHCHMSGDATQAVLGAPHFRCPDLLELDMNLFGSAGVRALLAAPGLERLLVLDLRTCDLDDDSIADLAACPRLANLLHLDVSNNRVGPAGAEALAGSPHLRRLASLQMPGCSIGGDGARALLRSPWLRRLVLNISRGRISAQTLAALGERYCLAGR